MQTASVSDILHMEHVLCVILEDLSATDLLSLARTSTACRSAVRPRSLELSVCNGEDLRVLQNLKSLGCLQHLQQVKTQVDENNYMFKATLQVLATCPSLKRLNVKLAFCLDVHHWVSDLCVFNLPHLDRTRVAPIGRIRYTVPTKIGTMSSDVHQGLPSFLLTSNPA